MLKWIMAIGCALIAYGLYFMAFMRHTLDISTEYVWMMRFRGVEVQLFSKEILAFLCIVGGAFIVIFTAIVMFKGRKR